MAAQVTGIVPRVGRRIVGLALEAALGSRACGSFAVAGDHFAKAEGDGPVADRQWMRLYKP